MNPGKVFLFSLVILAAAWTNPALGEDAKTLEEKYGMEWFGMAQLWSVYSLNAQDSSGADVDDRWDLYIRRGRLGVNGSLRPELIYTITMAYDNLGKNGLTPSTGTAQETDNKDFYVWDTSLTWRIDPKWLDLSAGYFRPQVSRESITTSFKINSFFKAFPSAFTRDHIVGRGSGRETGVNLGGLHHDGDWGFNYNVGVFDTNHEDIQGDAVEGGRRWAPLIAGRTAFTIGEPEMDAYSMGYTSNYYGERKGATLAVNYTHQGETDVFERNNLFGLDLLANYANLNLGGEIDWLKRDSGPYSYTDLVYHGRIGWNIPLSNGQILEPVLMYTRFNGDENSVNAAETQSGTDAGVNWYLDRHKLKLNLHYAWQEGRQPKNDRQYLALGLQVVF